MFFCLFRAALASWFMMNLLLIVVPRYGAYAMIITALFLLSTCFVYHCMLPVNPLVIRFEENRMLTFGYGWCFWLTLFAGKNVKT
jgi:dual oxidase maturation factor 1